MALATILITMIAQSGKLFEGAAGWASGALCCLGSPPRARAAPQSPAPPSGLWWPCARTGGFRVSWEKPSRFKTTLRRRQKCPRPGMQDRTEAINWWHFLLSSFAYNQGIIVVIIVNCYFSPWQSEQLCFARARQGAGCPASPQPP